MKILFIYSIENSLPINTWSDVQFGISYISSILKSNGFQTRLMVLSGNTHSKSYLISLQTILEEFNPRLICFTAVFSQYKFIKEIAGFIKKHWPQIYLLIGGVHATLNPQEVIVDHFDAVCIGEGEFPVLELCNQLKGSIVPHNIPNIWIKKRNGEFEKSNTRDFIQNLDILPFPDREIWRPWIKERTNDELAILAGRGCPYNCTYCSNHMLRKIANGNYVRMRSTDNIIDEVKLIYRNFLVNKIYLEVETIALDKAWVIELCHKLEIFNKTINNSISYGCNFRISSSSVDENIFIALKKANFYKINIGLESGSEQIRQKVLKRYYSNDDFLKAVNLARKYGLKVYIYNIIGLPEEKYQNYLETVEINRLVQPDFHYTGIFFPYPGTKLYDYCIQNKLINKDLAIAKERQIPVIDLPNFPKNKIVHEYHWFEYRVYKGYKPMWKILINVFKIKLQSFSRCSKFCRCIIQWPIFKHLSKSIST